MIFVTCLFTGHGFDRDRVMTYGPRHVAVLANMLRRHGGHELVCVHDGQDLPAGVTGVQMPDNVAALPRYYPKTWALSDALGHVIGETYAAIDLDVVIVADPAAALPADVRFASWDQARGEPYNSSLFVLEPGARREVWDRFSVEAAEKAERTATYRWTGDQSWIAHVLGPGECTFGEDTGILQYRPSKHRAACPEGARALFMCGPYRPDLEAEHSEWVREAYR